MSPAGVRARLEVSIADKAYRTAGGEVRPVLRDVSLSVQIGEVCALVGPSGCGKSTLLRIIAGLDRDYRGSVQLSDSQRIGMVFQEPRLLPWRTVMQNLRLAAPAASQTDLDRLTSALGIAQHLHSFPGELSLGLARRVALARAFAVRPGLLLLDEPFVSLDAALAARLRNELADLVDAEDMTTLLVTHDIEEAIRLADRIVLLSAGPAHIIGEVSIEHPRQTTTADSIARMKDKIAGLIAKAP